jgi:hypothetical protein
MAPRAGVRPNVEIAATAVMILNPRRMYSPEVDMCKSPRSYTEQSCRGTGFDSECRKSVVESARTRRGLPGWAAVAGCVDRPVGKGRSG